MAQDLKTVLDDRARSVAFRPPDLQGIRRAGNRRVRRRWAGSALASVAAGALVAGAVVIGMPRDPAPVGSPWPADAVTWAVGSTIHIGTETVEVGHAVLAYVRTSVGFATVDGANDVYSVTTGGVTHLGTAAMPLDPSNPPQLLAADARGTLVGWVGQTGPGSLAMHTYDQATGQSRSYPVTGPATVDDVAFFAIDDRTGYWRLPSGVHAVDLDTGDQQLLVAAPDGASGAFEIFSVENGVVAFSPDGRETILAGASIETATEMAHLSGVSLIGPTRLAPSGVWLSIGMVRHGSDDVPPVGLGVDVYNTGTRERVRLDLPGTPALEIPVVWLDSTTLQVVAVTGDLSGEQNPETVHIAMYACTVPGATCQLAVDLGTFSTDALLVLPGGLSDRQG
jgi:hypothetical protein